MRGDISTRSANLRGAERHLVIIQRSSQTVQAVACPFPLPHPVGLAIQPTSISTLHLHMYVKQETPHFVLYFFVVVFAVLLPGHLLYRETPCVPQKGQGQH